MLGAMLSWAKRLVLGRFPNSTKYRTVVVDQRAHAEAAIARGRTVAIFAPGGHPKWMFIKCPCRCGDTLAVNLMVSESPCWTVSITTDGKATVYPSVDSTRCGAHFWIRDGGLTWCE